MKNSEQKKEILNFESKFFLKTGLYTIAKHDAITIRYAAVMALLEPMRIRERERDNPETAFSDLIIDWFVDEKVPAIATPFVSCVYRVKKQMTLERMFKEADKLGITKVYNWLKAILIIEQTVLAGEVDDLNSSMTVFFKSLRPGNGTLYRLTAYRRGTNDLEISVEMSTDLQLRCLPGEGICFVD